MNLKRKATLFLSIIMILSNFQFAAATSPVTTVEPFKVNANSAILIETSSGKLIMEQNADTRVSPASITKIMTLILIYDAISEGRIAWDDIVTISEYAASMGGSQIYLEPNEQQTIRDLTKSIAIASANDAAVAIAEHISGNMGAFVNDMNVRADGLGMSNTHFMDPCGLSDDDNHYTSARDVSIMSRELLIKYPEVKELTTTWIDSITHKTRRGEEEFGLTNTNILIKSYQGMTGLKTGSTNKAKYCLAASAERNGLSLISVVMGAPDYKTRFQESIHILDYGFANFGVISCDAKGTVLSEVDVHKGLPEKVSAIVDNEVSVLISKGVQKEIDKKIETYPYVMAPVVKGEKIGEVIYTMDGSEVGRADLVAAQDVVTMDIRHMITKLFKLWVK